MCLLQTHPLVGARHLGHKVEGTPPPPYPPTPLLSSLSTVPPSCLVPRVGHLGSGALEMGWSLCWVWTCVWQDTDSGWPPSAGYCGPGLGLPGPGGTGDLIWIQGLPQLSRKTQEELGRSWVGEVSSQQLRFQTRIPQFKLLPPPHSCALSVQGSSWTRKDGFP